MTDLIKQYSTPLKYDQLIVIVDENDGDEVHSFVDLKPNEFDERNIETSLEAGLVLKTLFSGRHALANGPDYEPKVIQKYQAAYSKLDTILSYEDFQSLISDCMDDYTLLPNGHTLIAVYVTIDGVLHEVNAAPFDDVARILENWNIIYSL